MYTRFVDDEKRGSAIIYYPDTDAYQPRVQCSESKITLVSSCYSCGKKTRRHYQTLDGAIGRMMQLFREGRVRRGDHALSAKELEEPDVDI